jgi:DNA-binding Lrp family transcriptional regulator
VIIDPIDLKLIRQLELQGSIPIDEIVSKFHITNEEILLRIKNFEESGFISDYGLKLFVPGIIGGKWYWVCAATESTDKLIPEKSILFLEEVVENLTYPAGVCPNISMLFYTRDLARAYKMINKIPGLRYAEIYKINTFNVPVPKVLSESDFQMFAKLIDKKYKLNYAKINSFFHKPSSESDIQLSRLLWSKSNKKGTIYILPNFDWSVIKNYTHLHLAITTKMRIKELRKKINSIGFSGNITSRFKKRYLQIEFDIWGFSDIQKVLSSLRSFGKISVEGCSFAHKNKICDDWIKDFVKKRI